MITAEERAAMRAADMEIEAAFRGLTAEEMRESRQRDIDCRVVKYPKKRAYNAANRERIAARKKAWRTAHREEIRAYWKAYYEAHREEILARNRASYEARRLESGQAGRA